MKNREIKFRAWNKKRKEMLKVVSMSSGYSGCQGWFITGEKRGDYLETRVMDGKEYDVYALEQQEYDIPDIILMQYTGLKDRNGTEIYEGDIIDEVGDVRVVKFKNGSFYINAYAEDNLNSAHICEVIGNKFQNPELLENLRPLDSIANIKKSDKIVK